MGAVLGSCAAAVVRCVPRRLLVGSPKSPKIASESPLTDDEIMHALRTAPLVHPTTPKEKLPGRVSRTVQRRLDQAAGPTSQAKTGDVILFDKKAGTLSMFASMVGLQQRKLTVGCFTHAGIVIRLGARGDDSRVILMESVLASRPYDMVDGASQGRLAGSIRFYPLRERLLTYPGTTFLLPLKERLSPEAEQRLLTAACAIWRRNPDFDIHGLVAAGFDRLPVTRALYGNRFEPEEDLEAFFCSELVGHLLEVALEMPLMANESRLAPNDLLKMPEEFDLGGLVPARLYHGEKDLAMEGKYELIAPDEEVWSQVDQLATGDVLLVKATHTLGRIIQLGDWTDWDHVAMVVRQRGDGVDARRRLNEAKPMDADMYGDDVPDGLVMFWPDFAAGQLQLLEATKAGAFSYPLQELLQMRGKKYSHVALRKLDPPLSDEQCAKVEAFVSEIWARPYDLPTANLKEVLKALVFDDPGDAVKDKEDEGMEKFFCSELVAEALQQAGVLPERTLNSNEILPSMFAHGGAVDRILAKEGRHTLGGREKLLYAPQSEFSEFVHEGRDRRLGKLEYMAGHAGSMVGSM